MNAQEIKNLVRAQIQNAWDTTNHHQVNLREALVDPRLLTVIDRMVEHGKMRDRHLEAWLVLIENPHSVSGYRIVASSDGSKFGLASEGFPADEQ